MGFDLNVNDLDEILAKNSLPEENPAPETSDFTTAPISFLQGMSPSRRYQQERVTLPPPDPRPEVELGWHGVAAGLNRILIGYSLILFQIVLAAALIAWLIGEMPANEAEAKKALAPTVLAACAGLGIIALISLLSGLSIIIGKLRCAIDAPDKAGARWMMFACVTCLVSGTMLSTMIGIFGPSSAKEFTSAKTQEELFSKMPVPSAGELGGMALNLAAMTFFVLFLRSIGARFERGVLTGMADLFLILNAVLMGITVQLFYFSDNPFKNPMMLVLIGLGWLILGIWYVALIAIARLVLAAELAPRVGPMGY